MISALADLLFGVLIVRDWLFARVDCGRVCCVCGLAVGISGWLVECVRRCLSVVCYGFGFVLGFCLWF